MDEDLKTYLEEKFSEVRAEIGEVRGQIGEVRGQIGEVRGEIGEVRGEIEASETRLLTEFWKWGRVAEQRIRRMEHSDATTTERLTAMEERIFTLERKVAGSKN